jgi:hypothetical protein
VRRFASALGGLTIGHGPAGVAGGGLDGLRRLRIGPPGQLPDDFLNMVEPSSGMVLPPSS